MKSERSLAISPDVLLHSPRSALKLSFNSLLKSFCLSLVMSDGLESRVILFN